MIADHHDRVKDGLAKVVLAVGLLAKTSHLRQTTTNDLRAEWATTRHRKNGLLPGSLHQHQAFSSRAVP